MAYGQRKGYSDCIRGVRARNILDAGGFAAELGRCLDTAMDFNFSKTTARDDHDGKLFAASRKKISRWLRQRGALGLTCTWARERPTIPVPRPNAHMNLHVPVRLYDAFVKDAHTFWPPGCTALSADALYIQRIGMSEADFVRRQEYIVKGAHPKARLNIKKKRIFQGRITGKRAGTSEDIGLAARLNAAQTPAKVIKSATS